MIVLHDPIREEDANVAGGVTLAELDPLSVTVPQVYKGAEAESVGLHRCLGTATLKHLGVKGSLEFYQIVFGRVTSVKVAREEDFGASLFFTLQMTK
jgi:hypothetical protein